MGTLAIAAAAALPAIFGIQLGAPVDLPECRLFETLPRPDYDVTQPVICYEAPIVRTGETWPTTTIVFPPAASPLIVKNWNVRTMVIDGKIAGMQFYTSGVSDQELVLLQLTAKFGKPTTSTSTPVQTRVGASYSQIDATWSRPEVSVRFEGMTDTVEMGEVTIDTPAAAAVRAAALKADIDRRPAL